MIRRVLLDTSAIIALLSEKDDHHGACVEALARIAPPLLTCWPVITEAVYLLQQGGASADPIFNAFDQGLFKLLPIPQSEMPNVRKFMTTYRSIRLQIADACLTHLADREKLTTILTLDRRDFSVVRIGRRALTILPG